MAFIHNGNLIDASADVLETKWKTKTVYGSQEATKPGYCIFNNTINAINMLRKHILANSRMFFHTDVDMDGIGSTYILKTALCELGSANHKFLINKDKVHGIQQKHADFINKNKCVDLLIISDSSSNDIDIIKQMECDVLCIDHHDLLHRDLYGKCNDGVHSYVIVNSTIDNDDFMSDNSELAKINSQAFANLEPYKGTETMSCGLVIYELLRVYFTCFNSELALENKMLYQWTGVTLYTDVIDTLNDRDQWYLDKTIFDDGLESTLKLILRNLNSYKYSMDKSYIQYTFAPVVNKTIRAGETVRALTTILTEPFKINELKEYGALQDEALEKALYVNVTNPVTGVPTKARRAFDSEYIVFDTDSLDINPNYNGVIASRMAGDFKKNTVVCRMVNNQKYKGSFRGRYKSINYRKFFAEYSDDIYAQGHSGAFGFEATQSQLFDIMSKLHTIEGDGEKVYFSYGDIPEEERGEYHITDMQEFKRQGYLYKIAVGNSKVSSLDEVNIRIKTSDLTLVEKKGSLYIYKAFGIKCKAFSAITTKYVDIYLEFSNEISAFLREV